VVSVVDESVESTVVSEGSVIDADVVGAVGSVMLVPVSVALAPVLSKPPGGRQNPSTQLPWPALYGQSESAEHLI
jgi:hypothetical protein